MRSRRCGHKDRREKLAPFGRDLLRGSSGECRRVGGELGVKKSYGISRVGLRSGHGRSFLLPFLHPFLLPVLFPPPKASQARLSLASFKLDRPPLLSTFWLSSPLLRALENLRNLPPWPQKP